RPPHHNPVETDPHPSPRLRSPRPQNRRVGRTRCARRVTSMTCAHKHRKFGLERLLQTKGHPLKERARAMVDAKRARADRGRWGATLWFPGSVRAPKLRQPHPFRILLTLTDPKTCLKIRRYAMCENRHSVFFVIVVPRPCINFESRS